MAQMIRSMTAYGRAGRTALGKDILVEIKSVNNRYFDMSVKLPRAYGFLEEKIKAYIGSNGIARGKIDVYVSVETLPGSGTEIALNEAYAAAYLKALRKLRDTFDIKDDISVMRMAQNRDIFAVGKQEESPEEDWDAVRPALDEALAQFLQMREAEGERLAADISEKKERIAAYLVEIEKRSSENTAAHYHKMLQRIRQLLADSQAAVEEGRLLTECAVFADKTAVDEETVRLRSHLHAFDAMLAEGGPVGRKLDFLLQEMNRETNTIGSKANDLEIAKLVIEIKSELEKIREQIQNIE